MPARPCLPDGRAPDCIQAGRAVSDVLPQHLRREQEEWAPQKHRAKRQQRSTRDEATGQTSGGKAAVNRSNTFGSGGSAFRVRPYDAATLNPSPSIGLLIQLLPWLFLASTAPGPSYLRLERQSECAASRAFQECF